MQTFHSFEQSGWQRAADRYGDAFGGLTSQTIPRLLAAANVSSGTRLLDVASGPGYVAAAAAAVGASAVGVDFDPADVIYVNAGATRPLDLWLDRLKDGGRMILALTKNKDTIGAWFLIERRGDKFLANWISAAGLFPCAGARDAESERALVAAFEKGGWDRVTRLYRRGDVPEERCWLKRPDWCLAYD